MTDLYLILHKVRGEPAFDIAHKIMVGEEEGWIIPTSGHRAYPSWWRALNTICLATSQEMLDMTSVVDLALNIGIPNDWPDHYDAKRDDGAHLVNAARDILMRKGRISVAKPSQPTFRRR